MSDEKRISVFDVDWYVEGLRKIDDHNTDLDAMTDDEVRDWLEQYGDLTEHADYVTGYWCDLEVPPIVSFDFGDKRVVTLLSHAEGEADRSDALRNTAKWWQEDLIKHLEEVQDE